MERVILHCDLNNFFASVECMLNPELRGKAVAVCGSKEDRHGIVLAKSEPAKKMGVKTGEAIWQAQQKCKDLIIVSPNYSNYVKYSNLTKDIYYRFTDMIEPFGIDECWLDVTGSTALFGSGEEIAYLIKDTVKKELGLTISIGVSFNKIFAKLGSDMKKPDAVTCIYKNDFKDKVWCLPACDLLGVGYATTKRLKKYGIFTIGQLAKTTPEFMQKVFGINGLKLWLFANGQDESRVANIEYKAPYKSIGNSITCMYDLESVHEVWCVFFELSQKVAKRLRDNNLLALKIQISVKDNTFIYKEYQCCLDYPTCSYHDISNAAIKLFKEKHIWVNNIRAIGVRTIGLIQDSKQLQYSLFYDLNKHEKINRLEQTVERIRDRYGNESITNAVLMRKKTPDIKLEDIVMPGMMYT